MGETGHTRKKQVPQTSRTCLPLQLLNEWGDGPHGLWVSGMQVTLLGGGGRRRGRRGRDVIVVLQKTFSAIYHPTNTREVAYSGR